MRQNVKLLRTLVLGSLLVGLYMILVIAFHLHGGPPSKLWNENGVILNTIEGDGRIPFSNFHFGGLNQHAWYGHCITSFEQLCSYPIFPKGPDARDFAKNVNITSLANEVDGLRLLGFLRPIVTGEYIFVLMSNGLAEVWLSSNRNWKNARKIAYATPSKAATDKLGFGELTTQISHSIPLAAKQTYYFEVIYANKGVHSSNASLIQLAWKRPDKKAFEIIDRTFFLPYTNDIDKAKMKVYDDNLPDVLACAPLRQTIANEYMRPEKLPVLENTDVNKALDFCEYRPSYLLDPAKLRNFKPYSGVRLHLHKTVSFPYPDVYGVISNKKVREYFKAEAPLAQQEARSVVVRYMEALEKRYPGKYKLEVIQRVEKKRDPNKGIRYLLELVVKDLTVGTKYTLSEFVFNPVGANSSLCYPKGLQWNRKADVYLILTAKNLGRWVHYFIKNVEKIVQETRDEHLHVVVYDFDSPDIDLKQAFQRSALKNYHFITKPGKYSRTASYGAAIQSIKDPDAIVVTIDLHLDIGSQLINDIRKHCSKGKTVYAPEIVYLDCGGSSAVPKGVWYHYSYGTIAMYKQDWENFGGFSKAFKNKSTWGGEDWDIIDNAVKSGLEIERKRAPWLYHYHHTKAGMWQKN